MINAMEQIDSSGGKVVYNAPLLMPGAIMKQTVWHSSNDGSSE